MPHNVLPHHGVPRLSAIPPRAAWSENVEYIMTSVVMRLVRRSAAGPSFKQKHSLHLNKITGGESIDVNTARYSACIPVTA